MTSPTLASEQSHAADRQVLAMSKPDQGAKREGNPSGLSWMVSWGFPSFEALHCTVILSDDWPGLGHLGISLNGKSCLRCGGRTTWWCSISLVLLWSAVVALLKGHPQAGQPKRIAPLSLCCHIRGTFRSIMPNQRQLHFLSCNYSVPIWLTYLSSIMTSNIYIPQDSHLKMQQFPISCSRHSFLPSHISISLSSGLVRPRLLDISYQYHLFEFDI